MLDRTSTTGAVENVAECQLGPDFEDIHSEFVCVCMRLLDLSFP